MTSSRSVVLAAPVRTAIGTFGGSLKEVSASDLGAVAIGAAVERAGLEPDEIGTVVMGNVIQAGSKMNPARQAAINAGLPVSVPAMTVNRVCGSGAQAIVSAAHEIMSGAVDVAVAGGMENMDLAPYLIARGRWGYRMGDGQLYDSMLRDGLNDAFSDQPSGWHTEDLAQKFQITRGAQDQWAVRSQQRFATAQTGGKFKDEIVSVEVPGRKGPVSFAADEHNRPDTTLEKLAALKPAFRAEGTITAGNAPGLNSGAAAVVLADQQWSQKRGLVPMARLVSYGVAAVEPGHVRPWADPGGAPGARSRRLETRRRGSDRDQRGVRGHCHRGDPRARVARGQSQCRGRRHRSRPPHRGNWCSAHHPPRSLDAA